VKYNKKNMNIKNHNAKVSGKTCSLSLMEFDKADSREWKKLFDRWKALKLGMRKYQSREPNFPEGLSEVAFCLWSGSLRFISAKGCPHSSFDTFNIKTGKTEQVKASSVEFDLTSFGPRSKWDDIYFLDFYNGGKLDGTFNVYKIPTKLVHEVKVKKTHTFLQRQAEGKRPRFSIIKSFIKIGKIKPIERNVKVW